MSIGVLTIIMVFAIPLVAIIGGLAIAALKILKGGHNRATREQLKEETRLVQEIHGQLLRMEERIEALETLVIDREREKSYAELRRSGAGTDGPNRQRKEVNP